MKKKLRGNFKKKNLYFNTSFLDISFIDVQLCLKKFDKCKRYVYSNVYFNLFLITDKMQLGPAPVEAVRRGDLGMGYDVDFVYSEVNADVQTFLADPNIDWGFRFGSSNVGPLLLNRVGRN